MKKILNGNLLFLFLIIFLLSDSFSSWILKEKEFPEIKQQEEYQHLVEEYQTLLNQKNIDLPQVKESVSKVYLRDPFTFFNEITILKGKEEDISLSSAVLKDNALIGIITSTSNHTSKVRLLTNTDTSISVKIKDTYGILTTNKLEENWINNLTKDIELQEGDKIYTSGLTEVPGNIFIGTIAEINKDQLGLTQSIKVRREADLNDLNYVTIMTKEVVE